MQADCAPSIDWTAASASPSSSTLPPQRAHEIRQLLEAGPDLPLEQAREIAALGLDVVPLLIEVLQDEAGTIVAAWTAACLACAIGDAAAVPSLVAILEDPETHEDEVYLSSLGDAAGQALASIGLAAVEPVVELLENGLDGFPGSTAIDTLAAIAVAHPQARPRAAGILLRILQDGGTTPRLRASAVCGLKDLDWRDALPVVERALNRGEIDLDTIGPESVEEWRLGRARPRTYGDCLGRFTPGHRRALQAHRARVGQASGVAIKHRDDEIRRDLAMLRNRVAGAGRPKVGRNEPCPCGSGRKYKKCHLDAPPARGFSLAQRALTAKWPASGYAMLPSEQIDRLDPSEVEAHLDLLAMPEPQVRDAVPHLTDDYLLWAAAVRCHQRLDRQTFAALVGRIAASQQNHPALDYAAILATALSPAVLPWIDVRARQRLLQRALHHGDLAAAWDVAEMCAFIDPDRCHQLFDTIRQAHPRDPWTAVAMADAACGVSCQAVLDALESALSLVRSGEARPPCPPEVLEAFLADHRRLVSEGRLRNRKEWWTDDALSDRCLRAMAELRRERLDLDRRLRTDLEDLPTDDAAANREKLLADHAEARAALLRRCQSVAEDILEGRMATAADSPRVILVTEVRDASLAVTRFHWLLPLSEEEGEAVRSVAERAAGHLLAGLDAAPATFAVYPHGRGHALAITVPDPVLDLWRRGLAALAAVQGDGPALTLVRGDDLALGEWVPSAPAPSREKSTE